MGARALSALDENTEGGDGAVLGFLAEDCVRMAAAVSSDAAAVARGAAALKPLADRGQG